MNTDLLKTFLAICETKSFTAAADRVGRTQSAISLQMQRLELSLGRPLFVRGSGTLEMTEHGVLLQSHAARILESVADAKAAFDVGKVDGVVVLGVPEDYAPKILADVLRSFTELYPAATINLVLDESRRLVRHLAEGSVDLAFITEGEGPVADGRVAFRDQIVWVGREGGELHHKDPLPIAIWDENDGYSSRMFKALAEMQRSYRTVVISRSMTGLRGAVQSGIAVSAMMRSSIVPPIQELTEFDGFPPLDELPIRLERAHQKKSTLMDRLEAHLLLLFKQTD
ncbi:LysR family transcriptional regulator [Ruegeria sp. 2012CJ41-6]|uniref:LysR family transcriptional regulator n=1 Tax=Ruegeria spongiae TaxID=2942209 RepID=A0ABT0Q5M4_9RHOB|nr:LysR family transcriptional regulator [Ruegeria spongiae]MCL6285159.1 LysR family transcriptional regulator [Ruegeria spongiae]